MLYRCTYTIISGVAVKSPALCSTSSPRGHQRVREYYNDDTGNGGGNDGNQEEEEKDATRRHAVVQPIAVPK